MKANEINWKTTFNSPLTTVELKGHYKVQMSWGMCLPSTPSQARYFIKSGSRIASLNNVDVDRVESILNAAGFEGEYRYTKSKQSVQLRNQEDLATALKVKFNI